MTVSELLDRVGAVMALHVAAPVAPSVAKRSVAGVEYDSRQVTSGSVFVALRGQHADGATFAQQAIVRGAVAVVAESDPPPGWSAAWIKVADARLALAAFAAVFFHHPSDHLLVVGITGTNGKTTTSYISAAMFDAAGVRCGRIGTVTYDNGKEEKDAPRTTPEASDVQKLLREMVTNGCGACAAEISSHALVQKRADFIRFAAGIFTNLTRDHLDFHGDMPSYFAAKRRLFELLPPGAVAAVNIDDRWGAELAASLDRKLTYGIDQPADINPGPLDLALSGTTFEIRTPRGTFEVSTELPGRPNVYNILAATSVAIGLDLPFKAIQQGVKRVSHVPGRFQLVSQGSADDIGVVVDYAHTDDALKNVLETIRPLAKGRLVTVFGCGGDRDKTKRPLMGAVAARLSDLVVLTSDNPRSEDPETIIEEIKRGIQPPSGRPAVHQGQVLPPIRVTPYLSIVDREAAIDRAVREAAPGDVVLIAGKGHEKYQVIGNRTLPFDDVAVAQAALTRRRTRARVS